MTVTCVVCRAKTDANLCRPDTDRLAEVLAELPAWLDELVVTATRQGNTSSHDSSKPTKKFEQPMPFDHDAAELLAQAHAGLGSWVRHVAEHRGLTIAAIRGVNDMARWLYAAVDSIRLDEAAGEMFHAMTALSNAIRAKVDNGGRRWAGPCTAIVVEYAMHLVVDGDTVSADLGEPLGAPRKCGADLRTRPGSARITCHECGAVYDPIERARWIVAQSVEHHDTAAFIAAALTDAGWSVKANTIRKWAEREKIFAWREDDLGRPLYRVGDILDILERTRRQTA